MDFNTLDRLESVGRLLLFVLADRIRVECLVQLSLGRLVKAQRHFHFAKFIRPALRYQRVFFE